MTTVDPGITCGPPIRRSAVGQRMPPSLASRLLFHAKPPPPLFASHNAAPEITPEIYDFIALALRAYVSPWWSKISRYDKDFLPHISHILTHVLVALDHRILALDLPSLVFHDAPAIITQHYRDYHNAHAKTNTAYATGGATSLASLFSHLQPHMAISPEGVLDREYYRQIVDVILKATLPPEDYEPESERIIVREIIVKVLLDDIIPKIVQPWFIHKSILDLMGFTEEPVYISQPAVSPSSPSNQTFSFHTIIVLVLSALQSFSGMCLALIHGYKQAISTFKLVQQSPHPSPQVPFSSVSAKFQSSEPGPSSKMHRATSSVASISIPSSTSSVSSYPATSTFSTPVATPINANPPLLPLSSSTGSTAGTLHAHLPPPSAHAHPAPAYAYAPLLLLSALISAPQRFSASLTLTLLHMLSTALTPFLDKLLPYTLAALLSPARVLALTRTAKRTLFPNGYPGPTPPDPTPEEQAALRARLVAWRGSGGVGMLAALLLGPDPARTLEAALDPLGEAACNLRLVVFLLDRVLIGLFPELGGEGV